MGSFFISEENLSSPFSSPYTRHFKSPGALMPVSHTQAHAYGDEDRDSGQSSEGT
jgi:hypothetical protein